MSAPKSNVAHLRPSEVDYASNVGEFRVEVRKDEGGGSLVLSPSEGASLVLRIQGDSLELAWTGPKVTLSAPDADMELAAKNVTIRAEDTVAIHGRREVDVHSSEDVEIRADHQVNLWAHGILVGD